MAKFRMKNIFLLSLLTLVISGCQSAAESSSVDLGYDTPSSIRYTYHDLKQSSFTTTLNSVGQQKLLVVPVEFTDFKADDIDQAQGSKLKKTIDTAFFGASSETAWESVASYYHKSSYGKLTLTGEVTDWLSLDISATDLRNKTYYADPSYYVIEAFYSTVDADLLKAYDQDHDGDIDALCFIYAVPSGKYGDVFWAYAYWYPALADIDKPTPAAYMWASYDFMYEGYGETAIDAHTYIHEVGHLLGLDDYYNYDSTSKLTPAGHLDMMDRGVLDHNAFSKMALGWTLPKVVNNRQGDTKITLKPFESSGDFILIKDQWNGTPFDEYLLVEFYTPTGLNEKDASPEGYAGASYIRGFSVPGIKIYHIDARLVQGYRNPDYSWAQFDYIQDVDSNTLSFAEIGQANTPSHSTDPKHYLVHLLEATNVFSFKTGARARNETLFQEGSSFTADSTFFKNGHLFNDYSPVGYDIVIDTITNDQANITIKRVSS